VTTRSSRGRRTLSKLRRGRLGTQLPTSGARDDASSSSAQSLARTNASELVGAGWDHTAAPSESAPSESKLPLREQLLALFADPRVESLTVESGARSLGVPMQDIETTLEALVQAGELVVQGGASRRYQMRPESKARLESMFREAAHELGEQGVLMRISSDDALTAIEDEAEEPRLPVTAGLLSLFLPGTGQLLNGDVGRASLVFAVWSLAWITHLSPVWTFVCLYAGAEAFFTAKIRSMERKMAKEALGTGPTSPQLPPKPSST
jgi:hypothetical protein